MTGLGYKRRLFDHLIGACQQIFRHVQSERLGSLLIDRLAARPVDLPALRLEDCSLSPLLS
jgi:hypothetical protein